MAKRADILLIDDEEALCTAAEKILIKEGYSVTCVHTATEGLETFVQQGANLLITDLMLPDSDGVDVLRRAKEARPDVEVIVLTGHGTVEKAVEAMRLGAYDFIEKPLDRAQLLKAVAKAVGSFGCPGCGLLGYDLHFHGGDPVFEQFRVDGIEGVDISTGAAY